MLLDVLPGLSEYYLTDESVTNSKHSCDGGTSYAGRSKRAHLSDNIFGKFCATVLFPDELPTLAHGVMQVVLTGSKKEMLDSAATGIVASMTDAKTVRNGAVNYDPGNAMGEIVHRLSAETYVPIAIAADWPRPFVATVGHDLDFTVEADEVFRGILGVHVNLLNSCAPETGAVIPGLSLLYHRT